MTSCCRQRVSWLSCLGSVFAQGLTLQAGLSVSLLFVGLGFDCAGWALCLHTLHILVFTHMTLCSKGLFPRLDGCTYESLHM